MLNFDPWAELEKIRAEGCTPANPANPANPGPEISGLAGLAQGVLSEKVSEAPKTGGRKVDGPTLIFTSDDDEFAFSAIQTGCLTYGAIATATTMGATRAFQAVERLKEAGRIQQAKDGTLTIAGGEL